MDYPGMMKPPSDLEEEYLFETPTMEELSALAIAELIDKSNPGSSLHEQSSLNPQIPESFLRASEII
jgi:hypothetical protein